MALAVHGGLQGDFGALLTHGERNLVYATFGHEGVAIESRGIAVRATIRAAPAPLTFSVAVSLTPYEEQLWGFRSSCSAGSSA